MAPVTLVANTFLEVGESHLDQRLDDAEPGVVDQNVQMAELLQHLLIGALDVGFLRDIRRIAWAPIALAALGKALLVAPGNGDLRSSFDQCFGDGETDTVRCRPVTSAVAPFKFIVESLV